MLLHFSAALNRAFALEQWNRAARMILSRPSRARVWSKHDGFLDGILTATVLPLHEALVLGAPHFLIVLLVEAYPEGLKQCESSYHRLPLHCACRKPSHFATIEYLVQQYPDACRVPDALGRIPLHYALTNGADMEVLDFLIRIHPQSARVMDMKGFTLLHVACATGAHPRIVRILMELCPEAALARSKSGFDVKQCISPTCPHRAQLIRLLEESRNISATLGPTLQSKDEEKLSPLVLV